MDQSMQDTGYLNDRLAEAARYALVRRLAPVIRHNMASSMQPISMTAALLERRLEAALPDLPMLVKNIRSMSTLSREAAASCMDVMNWIAPRDNDLISVKTGVAESAGLLATDLSFRGFTLINNTAEVQAMAPRIFFRGAFLASLIALTDASPAHANIVLTAQVLPDEIRLGLRLEPTAGANLSAVPAVSPIYRKLEWADVRALASADKVQVRQSDGAVELCYSPSSQKA